VPRLPRHTLVDRAASTARLAVRPSRRSQGAYRAGTAPAYAPEKTGYRTLCAPIPAAGLLDAAEALRQAEADRKARGLVARLRAALRGE